VESRSPQLEVEAARDRPSGVSPEAAKTSVRKINHSKRRKQREEASLRHAEWRTRQFKRRWETGRVSEMTSGVAEAVQLLCGRTGEIASQSRGPWLAEEGGTIDTCTPARSHGAVTMHGGSRILRICNVPLSTRENLGILINQNQSREHEEVHRLHISKLCRWQSSTDSWQLHWQNECKLK
jgi:hypothetical protein